MELVNVRDLFRRQDEYVDQTITIGGWVRNIRNSKNFGFIVVNDGTFFEPVQVVYSDVLENFEEVEKLNVGAAIIVTGKLVATPGTKQPFEIQAEKVEVEGPSTPDYPLQKKKHSFEYLRTISHLRPRTNTFEAVFRVRSLCAYAIHKFFQERDFVYVHTPLITGSDCEGAGEMFQVTHTVLSQRREKRRPTTMRIELLTGMEQLRTAGTARIHPLRVGVPILARERALGAALTQNSVLFRLEDFTPVLGDSTHAG